MGDTKCWYCRHSVPAIDERGKQTAGCEWSLYKRPVPGWKARQTIVVFLGRRTESFEVFQCPKFERG